MPELPEVETICRGLRPHLQGRRLVRIVVSQPSLRSPVAPEFRSRLEGKAVVEVGRKGKYILIGLEGETVWIFHLGMSGKLIHAASGKPREKHDHIVALLDNGYELRYHDPRRFGLSVAATRAELEALPELRHLGLDPFDRRFDGGYLYGVTRNSQRRIRDVLIDQRVLAGLGNIYANEVLFRVGVRPTVRAWKLARSKVERIAEMIPRLLGEAIQWCGTSFSDYRDADDRLGEFQNHLRVYDREGEECRACRSLIKRVPLGNRSVFYCPACQT